MLDEVFGSSSLTCEFRVHQCDGHLFFPNLAILYIDERVVELWVLILLALENELLGVEELDFLCGHGFYFTGLLLDSIIPVSYHYLRLLLCTVRLRRCN